MTNEKETKDRKRPLYVYVTSSQRQQILENANAVNRSVSDYLCAVGCGIQLQPKADQKAVMDLMKVNADLGRVGGLLKLALTSGRVSSSKQIIELIKDIKELQNDIRQKAGEIK